MGFVVVWYGVNTGFARMKPLFFVKRLGFFQKLEQERTGFSTTKTSPYKFLGFGSAGLPSRSPFQYTPKRPSSNFFGLIFPRPEVGGKILVGSVEPSCDHDFHLYPSDPEVGVSRTKGRCFKSSNKKTIFVEKMGGVNNIDSFLG